MKIKLEAVTKVYDDSVNKVKALDEIFLNIDEGEFIAIIGESGSGKSTLLSLIAGLDLPTIGNIFVNEQNYKDLSVEKLCEIRREEISVIYQFYNLIPTLTVKENIILPLLIAKKEVNYGKVEELIKKLNLTTKEDVLVTELSGGQKQKVAVARAIITKSSIVLADEPTGNLDSVSSIEVFNMLKNHNKENKATIVIVTHNLELAKMCDRIITLKDGRIICDARN